MVANIYITGVIGENTRLLDVMRQVKSFEGESIERYDVSIDSVGGSVDEGKSIFNYLRGLNAPVRTIAVRAYSIAAHIFMAGQERHVQEGEDRVMIHMPFVQNMAGRSSDLKHMAGVLEAIEQEFVDFYTEFIQADQDAIRTLLNNETFLSGKDAFGLGLATSLDIPFKAVAYLSEEELSTNKNWIMKNADKLIKALKVFVGQNEEPEVKALVLQDANGTEIEFPDVAEDAQPAEGDRALVDGQPASGEYTSPEGETWVFEGGSLTEVRPAEAEEEMEELAEETAEESAEETVAEEVEVETEAEVEAEVQEDVQAEQEIDFEQLLQELFAKAKEAAKEELKAEFEQKQSDMTDEIVGLKKLLGSADPEVNAQEREVNQNVKSANPLQALKNKNKR